VLQYVAATNPSAHLQKETNHYRDHLPKETTSCTTFETTCHRAHLQKETTYYQ